ncbi:hypothetical protein E2C01_045686 [Portunus trituberculatus]|uniref:Uncharacterized protein n=1 Tax=Portunus trituberculatus TaxID=210409 RepID=A0A5B7FYY6_PORTR|nr:hypothetical protein [Portunus trituberculatus]
MNMKMRPGTEGIKTCHGTEEVNTLLTFLSFYCTSLVFSSVAPRQYSSPI